MEREHITGQAEDTSASLPIIEVGNAIGYVGIMPTDIAIQAIDNDIKQMRETLSYLTDVTMIEDFHHVQAPQTDILNRWGQIGYYGRFTSTGYHRLKAHFACHKHHMPEHITLDFITQIIEQYAEQNNEENYDD